MASPGRSRSGCERWRPPRLEDRAIGNPGRNTPAAEPVLDRPRRTLAARLPCIVLLLGLLGAVPLTVLTPPLQAPDEMQHFARAYQVSEGGVRTSIVGDAAGAVLPSSLVDMTEHFLGTRLLHPLDRVPRLGLRAIWRYRGVPLAPQVRAFVPFSLAALYPPWAYAPQAAGIALARAAGAGPLMLLTMARLANAVVAVVLIALAVRITPVGKAAFAWAGLLPMASFEYASAASDALLISSTFVFTALVLEIRRRGTVSAGASAGAVACALAFCVIKPVYAPLLLLPAPLRPPPLLRGSRRTGRLLLFQAMLLAVVLGCSATWLHYAAGSFVPGKPGTDPAAQMGYLIQHPIRTAVLMASTAVHSGPALLHGMVGVLGWVSVPLPRLGYALAALGLLSSLAAEPLPARPSGQVIWDALLVVAGSVLVVAALYAYWNPVGSPMVDGLQGRYFLPLLPAALAAFGAAVPIRTVANVRRAALATTLAVILLEGLVTSWTVQQAFGAFQPG